MKLWPAHYRAEIRPVTSRELITFVCDQQNITREEFEGPKRGANLMPARRIVAKILSSYGPYSFAQIAHFMNRNDHSTIIHHAKQCVMFFERDREFARDFNAALVFYQTGAKRPPQIIPDAPAAALPAPARSLMPRNNFHADGDGDSSHEFHANISKGSAALLVALQG